MVENPLLKFKYVVADFTNSTTDDFYDRIIDELKLLDISILVNNVGMTPECPGKMDEQSYEELRNVAIINTLPLTLLTHKFLERLVLRKNQKKSIKGGAIINISSIAGFAPNVPFMSVYDATTKIQSDFNW